MATIASLGVRIYGDSAALATALTQASAKMEAFGKKAEAIGQSLSTKVTAPLVAIGVASLKMSGDFETSMVKIETLVGLSREAVDGMRQDVLRLSGETARAPRELADALFVITSAGIRGSQSLEILEQSAKASAVGLGETADIARALTAVLQAYAGTGLTAAQATDQLLATVREGNLEASSLAPVLGRVIGLAANMGVSFAEVGANVATFTRLGVSAEQAITGLSGVLRAAIRPSEQAKQGLKELGLEGSYLRDQIQSKGLAQALVDLTQRFNGNTEALAKVIPEIEALSSVLGVTGAQSQAYVKIQESIIGANGLLESGFERVSETAGQKFAGALGRLQQAGIQLGDELVPMFERLANGVERVTGAFGGLSNGQREMIANIGILVAVVGPTTYAIGKMTLAVRALTIAMLANPYVAIGAGILAIGTYALFASDKLANMNLRVREALKISSETLGTEETRTKLVERQEQISKKIAQYEQQIADARAKGGNSPGTVSFVTAIQGNIDALNAEMSAIRDLYRESTKLAQAGADMPKIEPIPDLDPTGTIQATSGSIAFLTKELETLTEQFQTTTSGIERARVGDMIAKTEAQIEALRAAIRPASAELRMLREEMATDDGFRGSEYDVDFSKFGGQIPTITNSMVLLTETTNAFTSSFGAGMANVILQAETLQDTLKNIGKLLLSSAIQTAIKLLLTGTSGFGVAGGTKGLIGGLFGQVAQAPATITGQALSIDGAFKIQGTDLVAVINRSERQFR